MLGACATWSLITGTVHEARPEGVLLAVLAVAAGYAAGRICGALLPVAAPCAGALAGLGLTVAVPRLTPGPQIVAPLGHAGATAAVLTLCAGAACCAAWAAEAPVPRFALGSLAAGITVAAIALGSVSAFVACAAVLLCSLAAGRMRSRAVGIAGLAAAAVVMGGAVLAVAGGRLPGGLAASLEGGLTRHRVELWREALHLARRNAAVGVGPGRFGEVATTADPTLFSDSKPHSALLQQAAEQGVVGVVLLAATFYWILYTLWRSARPTPVVLSAGAALTAVTAIAAVGDALSFTAVPLGAGLLAGLATARPLTEEPPRLESAVRPRRDRLTP